MTNIFLSEIHLKDFRTFGDIRLSIPPGPGLTLLVGTNGLGKTSFFDAIEWCLTGTVKRFQAHVGRLTESAYLTRRDARGATHSIGLTFSEGDSLIRQENEAPPEDTLLSLLKDPEWPDIQNIGTYLGFTHFLGQTSQQRFTNRKKDDQWEALKGPSGIELLELIRGALRGRTTSLAFGRRLDREQQAITNAASSLEDWQAKVDRLAELQARAAAAGAENEDMLYVRLASVEQELPGDSLTSGSFLDRLATARVTIESEQQIILMERARLNSLPPVVERFRDASSSIDSDGTRTATADTLVNVARSHLSEAMLAATKAEQATAAQAEVVARNDAEYREQIRVRAAIAELAVLEVERQSVQTDEMAANAERERCLANTTDAQSALARARDTEARLNQLVMQEADLLFLSRRIADLKSQEVSARAHREIATAATVAADLVRSQLSALQVAFENARTIENETAVRLTARRQEASQFAELLSSIASHIQHDDTNCPVCNSEFPTGELRARAHDALAVQDARLADEARLLDISRERTREVEQQLTRAQSLMSEERAAVSAADSAETAVAAERSAIAEKLGVNFGDNLEALTNSRMSETASSRATLIRTTSTSPNDVRNATARVDVLSAEMALLEGRIASAGQRRARCDNAIHTIEDSLVGRPKPWDIDTAAADVETHRKLLDNARENLEALTLQRAAAVNVEAAARERLASAEAERSRTIAAIQNAEAQRATAVAAWLKFDMTGEPSKDAIDKLTASIEEAHNKIVAIFAEVDALAKSFEASLAQTELRSLRLTMNEQGGEGAAENPAARTQQLQEQLDATRRTVQITTSTRSAVQAYGEKLKAEADAFSSRFLMPLNELIDDFNKALLSTPGETVQFNAEHTVERSALAMRLLYADQNDNTNYNTRLPPQLVLSEGQMAANGFSILCAASTAYRWSRWRALLLDDPLQHNDIIHTAAFVDVMRNLVELENYQLLMSSHSRDEGEFIARKFDAANLPCTVIELVGASREGVQIAPPRPNDAAVRLVSASVARQSASN